MGKKLVLINVDFKDAYTDELYEAGDREVMTDERIAEINAVNPEFVTVIGTVEDEAGGKVEVPEEPKEPKKAKSK